MGAKNSTTIKLPGLVDIHTHLREPGATQKEDFETGTKAAIAGGFTQVLDMPNNNPPTTTPTTLAKKTALTKNRIWCDVGFNFGATHQSARYFKSVAKKVFGLKVYMNHTTGPLLIEKLKDRDLIFKSWTGPLPIMVHAEGETVEVAIKLARKYKRSLHVCHMTADQLRQIEKARKEGLEITCEITPHHLFLTKNDVKRLGPFGIMKPPLISKTDQDKLWANLDKIDVIATDHAPHTLEEKRDQSSLKFGVTGLETMLPLMLHAVSKRLTTIDRLVEMAATNPRRIFKIPTPPDTFLLVDFANTYKISGKNLFTKNKWTPFEGMEARGDIKRVVMRGSQIYSDGQFIGKPIGKVIYPEL